MFSTYTKLGQQEENVIFLGRLAEFRYYDMHQVIGSSMAKFEKFMQAQRPVFLAGEV